MKPLDKTKRYDLRKLNYKQINIVFDWLKENDSSWSYRRLKLLSKHKFLVFYNWTWLISDEIDDTNCATELFEEPADLVGFKSLKQELTLDDLHKDIKALSDKYRTQGFKIVVMFENL